MQDYLEELLERNSPAQDDVEQDDFIDEHVEV